jgi:hypothetical protein
MRLDEIEEAQVTSRDVHLLCDGFEMRGVHAAPDAAAMIKFAICWNGASENLEGDDVPVPLCTTERRDLRSRVSILGHVGRPQPAA